ncbi:MAG: Asp-tRNA(Asn)/Glu-tRNA(Gln) amidotransferase subunit GatA [Candidatus Pacebacteria bacterium]|nr:Asp-tRNA(Asn)/Glu-tRNA(Gln) amidotransferase subunit GatA [Candidatus Paceibacterota bacterium]
MTSGMVTGAEGGAKKLNEMTIVEAARALRARDCSVRELHDACITAAKEKNSEFNIYLEIFPADDAAIDAAQKRIDAEGDKAPLLCGIPLAIKDNILIDGHIASAASKMLENYKATYDATIIAKLKKEGALFIGRTNMDEFAMGSSTEHSAFGTTKNPYDVTRVPGGSSGGSAAAVAAHVAIAALGTDTGGSVRQPAAHTGLVGLKPTYGAVSRNGLIAMGSSLDQAAPLTKTVEDAKILFDAIKGNDPMDATTIPEGFDFRVGKKAIKQTGPFRIGVPYHLLESGIDDDLRAEFDTTLESLKKAGHEIVDISLPTSSYALAVYYVIMPAEVSTNLARLDGMRYGLAKRGATLLDDYVESRTEGFGPETKRRILLGTFVLSSGYIDAYYRKADAARVVLMKEYDKAFEDVDVIAFPTTPSPAFKFGEKSGDPVAMYLEDVFTVTANLTGMPAISVPMGNVERDGASEKVSLPVGIHLTAPKGAESLLFTIASAITGETL